MFLDAFKAAGRTDNFTYGALRDLYNYLDDLCHDTGEHVELDVIAMCCEYTEFPNIDAYNAAYGTSHTCPEQIDELLLLVTDDAAFGHFIVHSH